MATNSANSDLASEQFKDSIISAKNATRYLWSGLSERCKCSHLITDHSRNDDPREGRCVMRGCPCKYFEGYRHISQEVEP